MATLIVTALSTLPHEADLPYFIYFYKIIIYLILFNNIYIKINVKT
jgi:hypothetical protein